MSNLLKIVAVPAILGFIFCLYECDQQKKVATAAAKWEALHTGAQSVGNILDNDDRPYFESALNEVHQDLKTHMGMNVPDAKDYNREVFYEISKKASATGHDRLGFFLQLLSGQDSDEYTHDLPAILEEMRGPAASSQTRSTQPDATKSLDQVIEEMKRKAATRKTSSSQSQPQQ